MVYGRNILKLTKNSKLDCNFNKSPWVNQIFIHVTNPASPGKACFGFLTAGY